MIKNENSLLSKKKTRVKKPVKKEIPNRHIANKSRRKDVNGGNVMLRQEYPKQFQRFASYKQTVPFHLRFIDKIYNTQSLVFPSQNSCFTNGTFMFEDKDKNLFNALQKAKFSHAWYKNTHETVKNKQNFVCSSYHKDNKCISDKIHQYEIEIPDKFVNCGSDKIIKRVILTYNVKMHREGITKYYTFFKLESWPAISLKHTTQAFQRYILKNESTKTVSLKRREDCQKDKSGCKLYSQFLNKKYQDDHINYLLSRHSNLNQNQKQEIYHSFSWYDEFVRTGDEYFVPQYITNELLKI